MSAVTHYRRALASSLMARQASAPLWGSDSTGLSMAASWVKVRTCIGSDEIATPTGLWCPGAAVQVSRLLFRRPPANLWRVSQQLLRPALQRNLLYNSLDWFAGASARCRVLAHSLKASAT